MTAAAHWDILKQDLRYTARTLTRARGFAATAILVTAIWFQLANVLATFTCLCGG